MRVRNTWDYMDSRVLVGCMEHLIEETHALMEEKDRYGPHASDLIAAHGEFCLRRCVLAHKHTPNKVTHSAQQEGIFGSGTDMHIRWQRSLRAIAIEIEETHIHEGDGIRFTPDGVVLLPPYKSLGITEPCLAELKGYKQEEFYRLKADPFPPLVAYRQAQLYMFFLGWVRKGLIIVENKNTQEFWVWLIEYDPDAIVDLIERLGPMQEASLAYQNDERTLPERICKSPRDKLARECQMCEACFAPLAKRRGLLLPQGEQFKGLMTCAEEKEQAICN